MRRILAFVFGMLCVIGFLAGAAGLALAALEPSALSLNLASRLYFTGLTAVLVGLCARPWLALQ
jgi:hypothetical protein